MLVLPPREDGPPTNMAIDLWMLRAFPRPECPRFRHYTWNRPCHTFGYGQDFAWVSEQTGATPESLCRRPTGGGVVDHRDDWTYALVIPASHPAAGSEVRASYQALHGALGKALVSLDVQTNMVEPSSESDATDDLPAIPGKCFEEPVAYDLSRPEDGAKVAGAAMKRNREGLLLQGSVHKGLVGNLPWKQLAEVFVERIAAFLGTNFERIDWASSWEKDWQVLLKEIESAAWQRR
ncbi:MAG: hypothetical protein VCA36_10035 [Opitutales bacterium]